MYSDEGLLAGGCYLCGEGVERAAVAVCRRCGAFVCRGHSLRLLHPGRLTAGGLMGTRGRIPRKLEVICEDCSLLEIEDAEPRDWEKVARRWEKWATR